MPQDWKAWVRSEEAELNTIFQREARLPFALDDRNLFYVEMLADAGLLKKGTRLVDLGAGLAAFGPLLQKMGLEVTIIDTFSLRAEYYARVAGKEEEEREKKTVALFKTLGMKVIDCDLSQGRIPVPDQSAEVVTSFHMIEHFHHSPKPLFQEIQRVLSSKGYLVLAMPNAVNLRKRVWVFFGRNNFAPLEEWYYKGDPVFVGHVREPIVADLRQLMHWNGFTVLSTPGRNFIGRKSAALSFLPETVKSGVVHAVEGVLNFFPSLCSDIHAVGRKQV